MATHKTTIDGYAVELTTYTESGEPRSDCGIAYGKRHGSSLACAMDTGELAHHTDGDPHPIAARTLERIEEWALDNGY